MKCPHPQQAGPVVHEETSGEARATGIGGSLSRFRKSSYTVSVCADAFVRTVQGGHADGSGQSVTSLGICILCHQGPSHTDRPSLRHQSVPGQADTAGRKALSSLSPGLLSLKSTHTVLSCVPNSGAVFFGLSQECPEAILLHLLRMAGCVWGTHT